MNKVVIFAGSQDIETGIAQRLENDLSVFLEQNRTKIKTILFGGSTEGVMGLVHKTCSAARVPIRGYSLERFRKYDERNGVDLTFFPNDDDRIDQFAQEGSVFIALPGALGTLKEVLCTKDKIIESGNIRTIYIPGDFSALRTLLTSLSLQGMIHSSDLATIKTINSLGDIQL